MADTPAPDGSVAARWPEYREDLQRPRPMTSLGIPALDDVIPVPQGRPVFVALALPWEPAGETPFVITQALAKQGLHPLCINPSWSPYWDGALTVHRFDTPPEAGPTPYEHYKRWANGGPHRAVVIDGFSRLHWDAASSHDGREEVATDAGRGMLRLSRKLSGLVVVFLRRRTRDVVRMSVDDLRSDGALEYDTDALVMVDPHPATATADLLVVKHRNGPTGLRTGVPWPVLPRTVYRRASS